ncbi:MAG: acyl-CoA/acyl-ACP dehydrogenase [Actinomycetota bacterium]|nr:acyl-CoA/acyl-ACP dehydrogenase [Actinomycetota bacterium]
MFAPDRGEPSLSDPSSLPAAARRVANEVLSPSAEETDQAAVVPRSRLAVLADAGLFGLLGPRELGGSDASPSVVRSVFETLAGACGVTFFVWVQHHAPVRLLVASSNAALRRRLLPELCTGRQLGGVAFAHLRRRGPPPVRARSVDGGWVFSGEAPWVTSWGLAGLYAVAALSEDDLVVFAAVDGDDELLVPSPPLRLAAMNASATVRLGLHDLAVPDERVITVLPLDEWRARDRVATAQPNPAAFGVAGACTRLLAELDGGSAAVLEQERLRVRDESYRLADEGGPGPEAVQRLVELRAWSLELAVRSASALVAAVGGRSMLLDHPAQRLLREAAFYAIQAQTPAVREAALRRLQSRS